MEDHLCNLYLRSKALAFCNSYVLEPVSLRSSLRRFEWYVICHSCPVVYICRIRHDLLRRVFVVWCKYFVIIGYVYGIGRKFQGFRLCVELAFPSFVFSYHFCLLHGRRCPPVISRLADCASRGAPIRVDRVVVVDAARRGHITRIVGVAATS